MMNRNSGYDRLLKIVCTGAIAAGFTAPLVRTTPAEAACDAPRQIYKIVPSYRVRMLTNIRSDWAEGGFTINRSITKTATVNASVSGDVGFDVGPIVAKVKAQIGGSVGESWSKAGTWSYSTKVPPGKEGRVVLYHEGRRFAVTEKALGPHCYYVVRRRNLPLNVPYMGDEGNAYYLQLRSLPRIQGLRSVKRDDNYFEKEIPLPGHPR
jgi:hypothetical protein